MVPPRGPGDRYSIGTAHKSLKAEHKCAMGAVNWVRHALPCWGVLYVPAVSPLQALPSIKGWATLGLMADWLTDSDNHKLSFSTILLSRIKQAAIQKQWIACDLLLPLDSPLDFFFWYFNSHFITETSDNHTTIKSSGALEKHLQSLKELRRATVDLTSAAAQAGTCLSAAECQPWLAVLSLNRPRALLPRRTFCTSVLLRFVSSWCRKEMRD